MSVENQAPAYFDGICTVRRLRPFLRRRLRTARPHLSSMRVRKPCLRTRLVLRGLYVGLPMENSRRNVLENVQKIAPKNRPSSL